MSGLFILMLLIGGGFILVFIGDIWNWINTKDEVESVDNWNHFRTFGENNRVEYPKIGEETSQ